LAWGELQYHGKNIINWNKQKTTKSLNCDAKEPSTGLSIQVLGEIQNPGLPFASLRKLLAELKRIAKPQG